MPKLAVLGQPVAHSRSPAMQNAALAELGLVPEWSYEAIEVTPEGFAAMVAELASGGYAGVNVTVPHKLAALAAADDATATARAIGAANTLTFATGRISAENTDGVGIVDSLPGRRCTSGTALRPRPRTSRASSGWCTIRRPARTST